MKRRDLVNLTAGIFLGLLLAWLLGWRSPGSPPTLTTTATPPPVAQPAPLVLPTLAVTHSNVAMPVVPVAPAHDVDPSSATTKASDQFVDEQAEAQARLKAVTNNLRQLSNAAQSYMMEKGVTEAGYYDLVGDGTDAYLHNITPVTGEDYTNLQILNGQSQVELILPDGTTVTYDM